MFFDKNKYIIRIFVIIFINGFIIMMFSCNNIAFSNNTVENTYSYGIAAMYNNTLYYCDTQKRLTSLNLKTNEENVISESECWYLNIINNYIYYVNTDDNYSIYRMTIDGTQNSKICDTSVASMYFYQNKIYYIATENSRRKLYSMNLDGSDIKCVIDNAFLVYFDNNYIYYAEYSKEKEVDYINRLDMKTMQSIRILEDTEIKWFYVYKNNIYYDSFSDGIYEHNIKKNTNTKIIDGVFPAQTLNIKDGILYYRDFLDGGRNKKINLDTKKVYESINTEPYDKILILNDRIVYYEKDKMYIMGL